MARNAMSSAEKKVIPAALLGQPLSDPVEKAGLRGLFLRANLISFISQPVVYVRARYMRYA